MTKKTMRNGVAALITVALVAVGANAMAGQGMGSGRDGHGCKGRGQMMSPGDGGCGQRWADLTAQQRERLEAERQAFADATKQSRQDLYAKRLALKAELAKRDADITAAKNLQTDISNIQANLDQQRLEHIVAMRKIDPDAGRGFLGECGGRGCRGHGRQGGMGVGSGNCPFN